MQALVNHGPCFVPNSYTVPFKPASGVSPDRYIKGDTARTRARFFATSIGKGNNTNNRFAWHRSFRVIIDQEVIYDNSIAYYTDKVSLGLRLLVSTC